MAERPPDDSRDWFSQFNTSTPSQPMGADDFANQVTKAYQDYRYRTPSAEEIQSHRGNPGGLSAVLKLIQDTPLQAGEVKPTATTATTSTGMPSAPTAAYLQSLILGGMTPQAAIAKFNQETGRTTGNEAVFYPGNNTIGLPEAYLAGAGGWNIVQRGPEGPTTQGTTQPPPQPPPQTTTTTKQPPPRDPVPLPPGLTLGSLLQPFNGQMPNVPTSGNGTFNTILQGKTAPSGLNLTQWLAQYQPQK